MLLDDVLPEVPWNSIGKCIVLYEIVHSYAMRNDLQWIETESTIEELKEIVQNKAALKLRVWFYRNKNMVLIMTQNILEVAEHIRSKSIIEVTGDGIVLDLEVLHTTHTCLANWDFKIDHGLDRELDGIYENLFKPHNKKKKT